MDALLKKHRGGAESGQGEPPASEPAAPPAAWLPVLTQVIERGTPPAAPISPARQNAHQHQAWRGTPPAAPISPAPAAAMPPTPPSEEPPAPAAKVSDTLAEQLMSELAPRLSEVMEKQVAAELHKNIDQTVSSLLSQLDVNVREIVRDAVAEKLKQPRDPSA